jgi:hypothetical protein
MSGTILRSPAQAAQVFGSAGVPRQRHVFMVRFMPVATAGSLSPLTFVIKHCDRPKIAPKTEELNQYNKKRVVYTGFKYEPVRMTFYDSADGAAQKMWNQYAQYYFGDFDVGSNFYYNYDITTTPFSGSSFGLSEGYAGNSDVSSQWFFDHIEIYHFYYMGGAHLFDSYFLYHPRISAYEPDDLDYENSAISQISMSFVYENLQYNPGQPVSSYAFDEFQQGFYGDPLEVPGSLPTSVGASGNSQSSNVDPSISNLLSSVTSASAAAAPYRNVASMTTGALSMFGNYLYGGTTPATIASTAVNGSVLNNISAGVGATLSSPYGTAGNMLTGALLGTNGGLITTAAGSTLPSAAYGSINAGQVGTAQYGFNSVDTGSFDSDPSTYAASLASSSNGTVDDTPQIV